MWPGSVGHPACHVDASGKPSGNDDGKTAARPAFGSTRSIPRPGPQSASGQARSGRAEHHCFTLSKMAPFVKIRLPAPNAVFNCSQRSKSAGGPPRSPKYGKIVYPSPLRSVRYTSTVTTRLSTLFLSWWTNLNCSDVAQTYESDSNWSTPKHCVEIMPHRSADALCVHCPTLVVVVGRAACQLANCSALQTKMTHNSA